MHRLKRRSNHGLPAFAKMIDSFINDELFSTNSKGLTLWNSTMPAVNVKETDDQFEVALAAPGMEKSDFNIEVEDDVLIISSEKEIKKEDNTEDGRYTRREFSYSSFKRSFNLPDTVDSTKIDANYTDGILSLVIPKKEEAKPLPARKIEVK